jgi:DNA-binding transcriptional LysR family regulator
MQIDQLRLFLSIAAAGSFSRAATLGRTTQSAVSKQMLALEKELDCRLFERTGRGARLTDAGRLLLPRAESLVAEMGRLASVVARDLQQPRGQVRFAVQQSVSWPLVGHVHERMRRSYPQLRLEIFEAPMTQIDEWLREGRVDVGVLSRLPRDDAASGEPLLTRAMHLVSARGDRLTREPTIAFARLAGLPLIAASLSNAGRLMLEEEARQRGVELRVVLELNSNYLAKQLVARRAGYWIASRPVIEPELRAGTLSASRIVRPQIRQRFYLAVAGQREPTAAVRAVADLVREAATAEGA